MSVYAMSVYAMHLLCTKFDQSSQGSLKHDAHVFVHVHVLPVYMYVHVLPVYMYMYSRYTSMYMYW